jgi:hypothetical protein
MSTEAAESAGGCGSGAAAAAAGGSTSGVAVGAGGSAVEGEGALAAAGGGWVGVEALDLRDMATKGARRGAVRAVGL